LAPESIHETALNPSTPDRRASTLVSLSSDGRGMVVVAGDEDSNATSARGCQLDNSLPELSPRIRTKCPRHGLHHEPNVQLD
jgi:hypothetical protein